MKDKREQCRERVIQAITWLSSWEQRDEADAVAELLTAHDMLEAETGRKSQFGSLDRARMQYGPS